MWRAGEKRKTEAEVYGQCMDSVNVDCRARRRKPYCVEATCHLHRPHLEVGEYAVVRGSIGAGCHRLWLKAMPHDNDAF